MSITYKLELTAPLPEADLFSLLESSLGGERGGERDDKTWIAHDMSVTSGSPSPLSQNIVRDEFGFEPTSSIYFRFLKNINYGAAQVHLIEICAGILRQTTSDAVLLRDGEIVIFIRKSGVLTANSSPGFWTAPMLESLGSPPTRLMNAL